MTGGCCPQPGSVRTASPRGGTVSAVPEPALRSLVESGTGHLSRCDENDRVAVKRAASPGARLRGGRHPQVAEHRAHKREAWLQAPEALLHPLAVAPRLQQRRLPGKARSGERVGRGIGRSNMANHFDWAIAQAGRFTSQRKPAASATEAALDGRSGGAHQPARKRTRRLRHRAGRHTPQDGGASRPPPQARGSEGATGIPPPCGSRPRSRPGVSAPL